MKTLAKLGLLAALAATLCISSCEGDYYVADQPADIVYDRGAPPYQGAVWIEGDWVYRGGNYTYTKGHWDRPHPGHSYRKGNWQHTQHGYKWHKGHWE